MHDTLVAYIEGTLSQEERSDVRRRIQQSAAWQRELTHVQQVQTELQCQMPLVGRVSGRQLDALLPEILSKARQPTPKQHYWWKGLQILSVMTCVFGVLLMVPLVMQSAAADEQDSWSPNVPLTTSTPMHAQLSVSLEETEEPPGVRFAALTIVRRSSNDVSLLVHCEASPVPMPGATRIPPR